MTGTNGTWLNSPTSYALQWKRNGSAILGATASTYTLLLADLGALITLTVTATNAGGDSLPATSVPTAAVTAVPAPPPPPPPPSNTLPTFDTTGYRLRSFTSLGVGSSGDQTTNIKAAFNALVAGDCIVNDIPTFLTTTAGIQISKHDIAYTAVDGAGFAPTNVGTVDSNNAWVTTPKVAIIFTVCSHVKIDRFRTHPVGTFKRGADGFARGLSIDKSTFVDVTGHDIRNAPGAGIVFYQSTDCTFKYGLVDKSWADGHHITGSSQRVVGQYNVAKNTGDDAFSSIGYGTGRNYDIQFLDSQSYDCAWASGCSFEGTTRGKALRTSHYRTGVGGLRVSAFSPYNTTFCEDIELSDNWLEECDQRDKAGATNKPGHSSITLISTTPDQHLRTITCLRNTIKNTCGPKGVWARGNSALGNVEAVFTDTVFINTTGGLTQPFVVDAYAAITKTGSTLNGVAF